MSDQIDFTAIKRNVGLAVVLRRYHVPLRRSGRDQYRGLCPIHRGEGREAFHANLTRNIFHCFSCGAGGSVLDFVAAMEGCGLREAAPRLLPETFASDRPAATGGDEKQLVTKKRSAPGALGFALRGIDSAHPYLAARSITRNRATAFRPVSPNRESCSISTAPHRRQNRPWWWSGTSSIVSNCTRPAFVRWSH
jgi:DNA primase